MSICRRGRGAGSGPLGAAAVVAVTVGRFDPLHPSPGQEGALAPEGQDASAPGAPTSTPTRTKRVPASSSDMVSGSMTTP
jgi:hypothetical protein